MKTPSFFFAPHREDTLDIYTKRVYNIHINRKEQCAMKKDMDKIQFEYRYEIQELMKVIDKYVKQNPAEKENKTLERFFDLLDAMDMEW